MHSFWIVAALLTVVALAFVLLPLLRSRAASSPTVREANLAALRSQRQEIESDVAHGVLAPEAKEEALAELLARADEDLGAPAEPAAAAPRRPWPAAIAFAVLVPACAFGVYLWAGLPAALDPRSLAAPGGTPDHQMEELVAQLAKKVRERPDDVQGWSLLARSFNAMGRTQDALEAYAHLAKIAPNDAQVLADYADALALSRGRNLSGEPAQIVQRALRIDPKHPKSLALAATATLNEGKFAESIGYWQRLYAVLPPDSQDLVEIRNIVEDVRSRAAAAGQPQPPVKLAAGPATAPAVAAGPAAMSPAASPPPPAPPAASRAAPVPGKNISGTVKLAPALAGRVAPTDTLFIYARAAQGSRMPLAILRGGAGELPRSFDLDDSMGMAPNVRLSETASVVVEARLSKGGGAMAQPGDLVGTSTPVAPGARGVAIVIDKVVP